MNQRILVPLFILGALAACEPIIPDKIPDPQPPKELSVDHVRLQLSPAFAPGSAQLSAAETTRLNTFLDQSGLRPNEHIYIATANGDKLAAARIGRVAALLAQRGAGAETIPAPAAGVEPNHLLLLVDRYVVVMPSCPDWSKSAVSDHSNQPASNFGCSTASNLGLMLDDPRDLMQGRKAGPADADPALGAVARYRADTVKPFVSSGVSGGGGAPGGAGAGMSAAPAGGGAASPGGGGGQ